MNENYYRPHKSDLPEGAIRLSHDEVKKKQWEIIWDWKPHSEMWPFIHGPGILGGLTVLAGAAFLKHYRRYFKLQSLGLGATFLPTCGITTGFSMFLHYTKVQNEILTGQLHCPSCAEVRALSIQLLVGVLYPLLTAPVVTIAAARIHSTYPLPPLTDGKNLFNLLKKSSKPLAPIIGGMFLLNLGVTFFIVQKEGQTFYKIMKNSPLKHVQ